MTEGLYFWALKYSYEWQQTCLISWTKKQKQTLWQISRLKKLREKAEEMVRTADIIVTASWAGGCLYEFDERKQSGVNGLVTIGGRWFKSKQDKDWEVMWKEEDRGLHD